VFIKRCSATFRMLIFLAGAGLLILGACSRTDQRSGAKSYFPQGRTDSNAKPSSVEAAAGDLPSNASGYAHVTYRENVRAMEEAEARQAVIGLSTDEAAFLFDSTNATARALHAGDVLLIKNLTARKVLGTEDTPDGLVVLTEPAELTDVIEDGNIHIEAPVRFGALRAAASQAKPFWSLDSLLAEPAYAQSPEGVMADKAAAQGTNDAYGNIAKGLLHAVIDDWDTSYQATPGEGRTNLNLTLKKSVYGIEALITGQGYISNFGFQSDIGVSKGAVQNMDTAFKNLNGVMNFQWVIAKDSSGVLAEESRFKLPGALEVPLSELVGGLPMYLEVSAAILVHPAITGGKEYSKGQFRITYDGYQHFKVKPGNVDSDGKMTGDIDLGDHEDLSPVAPLGMVVAFCAPRIELSFGLHKLYDTLKNIKEAADTVDKYADKIAKRLFNAQQYANFQKNKLKLGDTFKKSLKSDAMMYLQTIATSASSFSGNSAIIPCERYDLIFLAQMGASAELAGISLGKTEKDIFRIAKTKIDPPGARECQNIGPPGK